MNRLGQGLIMMLFGFAILRVSLTDLYLNYVKEGLRPVLIITGVLLVITAAATLRYDRRRDRQQHAATEEPGHHHHESRTNWLLLLPILCVILITPPALGSYAASQQGTVVSTRVAGATFHPLPAGDPLPIGVKNYASRAILDDGRTLTGRTLRLTGFVTPGPDGRPMLARMVMSCCAADGRPVKVGLDGDLPATVAVDTWLQVDGAYSTRRGIDPINKAEVPYLAVSAWQEIPAPTRQYE